MSKTVTIPDLHQNYPVLAVAPTPYLGDGTGTCPQCETPGVLLVFTATDPQWIHCCRCGLNCSLRRLISGADPAHRQPMGLWYLYLLSRYNFLQGALQAPIRMRYDFSYHPDAPNRVGFGNLFAGMVELAVFRKQLRELEIDMGYRSAVPRRGEALIVPCCAPYGHITGFCVLPAEGPECFWWRRGYESTPAHLYIKVRPQASVIDFHGLDYALDRGREFALLGFNTTLRCAATLHAPTGMRETISPAGPVVDCRTIGQFDSSMTRICPATRRVQLPSNPPEPPPEIMPQRRCRREANVQ